MNFRRFILLLSTLLVLFLAAVWFMAPLWVSKVAEQLLAGQQCSEVIIDIDEIAWHKSRINRLYCKDQQGAFELDLTGVEIDYDIPGLLQERIEHVELEDVRLQLYSSSDSKAETKAVAVSMLTTPALLLERLPVSSFNVHNIHLLRLDSEEKVQQELRGYANFSDQALSLALNETTYLQGLQLKLKMDKKSGVNATLFQGKNAILNIESTVRKTDVGLSIDGVSDIKLAPLLALIKPWVNMPKQRLKGTMHASWHLLLPSQAKLGDGALLQQLSASTSLKLDFAFNRPDLGAGRGNLNLDLQFKQGMGVWHIAKRSHITLLDKKKTMFDLSGLSGSFVLSELGWRVAVAKKSKLQVKNIVIDDMFISQVQISLSRPVELMKDKKGEIKLFKKASMALHLPALKWQGNTLASQVFNFSINRGSLLSPSGSFSANAINFTAPTLQMPESNVSGTFKLSATQVSAVGKVDAQAGAIDLQWKLSHQLVRRKGWLEFNFEPLEFGVKGVDLSRMLDSQIDYAIDDGILNLNGRLQWHNSAKTKKFKLNALFDAKLSDLKGFYKTNQFSGLNGDMHFSADEKKLLMTPSIVSLDNLHAGVPINKINMSVAFAYPFVGLANLEVNQLQAEVMGGEVSSEKISIDLKRASNPFLMKVKHLNVSEMAELRQQEGLKVKGFLDGELPFNWSSDGLRMTAGELHADSTGGFIRYIGTESVRSFAANDQATKMALDIMNNFHYSQLKIAADYAPDGELKMAIKLKGNNPDYENGRAIDFNFNIEENILKLMQGLSIAGKISGAVEKKVQKALQ